MLARMAKGCASRREALELAMTQARLDGDGRPLSQALCRARHAETQARELARDVRTLVGWLGHDVLSLAGPELQERCELFDFVVEQLRLRLALAKQREAVLGFARVFDDKLAALAQRHNTPLYWVRQICRLQRKKPTSDAYWVRWNYLHARLGPRFVSVVAEVRQTMDDTLRASSLVENLNSRLRKYFFLRRHLSEGYLGLLQFFLTHRTFLRSRRARRVGNSPTELLTGRSHAHWLELLGFQRLVPA